MTFYHGYHKLSNYSLHPSNRKNHHFFDKVENTTTNMRYSITPSHNIQQKALRKK